VRPSILLPITRYGFRQVAFPYTFSTKKYFIKSLFFELEENKKMMQKEFDYYIFIDYSENLIGYNIIEKSKVLELLPKIFRFRHYKGSLNRKIYLNHIKNTVKRDKIRTYFEKIKILNIKDNIQIFAEVLEFIKKHLNYDIFISVDDFQYRTFVKLVQIVNDKTQATKESKLKEGSKEYQLSLVIDNLLNIERRGNK